MDGMALPYNYHEVVAAVSSDALLPWCLAFMALQLLIIYWSLDPSPPIQDGKRTREPRSVSTAGSTVGDNKHEHVAVAKSPSTLQGKRMSAQNKGPLVPSVTALKSRTRTASTPNKNSPAPFVRVTSAPSARNKKRNPPIPTNTSDSEATSDSKATSNSDAASDSEASSSKPARMRVAVRDPIALDLVFEKIAQWAHQFRHCVAVAAFGVTRLAIAVATGCHQLRLWAGQCRRYTTAAARIALAVSLMRAWHIRLHHQVLDLAIDNDTAKAVRPTLRWFCTASTRSCARTRASRRPISSKSTRRY
jgi:hypothetical protein